MAFLQKSFIACKWITLRVYEACFCLIANFDISSKTPLLLSVQSPWRWTFLKKKKNHSSGVWFLHCVLDSNSLHIWVHYIRQIWLLLSLLLCNFSSLRRNSAEVWGNHIVHIKMHSQIHEWCHVMLAPLLNEVINSFFFYFITRLFSSRSKVSVETESIFG